MALDGIFLYSIIEELKPALIGSRVDKINQPEKDEIILNIRGDKINYKLLISASANYPRIHFTNIAKTNPQQPPMFCMVLRKYLSNSKIIDVRQVDGDRIAIIDFESVDDLGFDSVYSLVVEIMGRHSNITLLRTRDHIIMDSIKHITPEVNSYRSLYPNIPYKFPPSSGKLNPFSFDADTFTAFIIQNDIKVTEKFFTNIFTGVASQLSKELFFRLTEDKSTASAEVSTQLYGFSKKFFEELQTNRFYFAAYMQDNRLKDFYCIPLRLFSEYERNVYDSPSKLLEAFYYEKDKMERINARSADLQKIINNNLDRCNKKVDILENTLEECKQKDILRIKGELLTANIYSIVKGASSIEVQNYYSEDEETVTIDLDEMKNPSENIQHYYKRYNKLKKSEEAAVQQIDTTKEEINYLQSVLTNIKNVEKYEEIEEIRNELMETGYIRFKKQEKKKTKALKPLHFLSSDGLDIYVGKNNIQNDFLTLKFANKQDLWLHTKDIPGSHVIIRHQGSIPEKTLEEASILAAYYSKAKDSSKVPVDYTEIRNVKKPSGAKPGMVIYYTNKTLYVTPRVLDLKKID